MGWLEDERKECGFKSNRQLAAHLLQHPGRPGELTLENLANNLGKLNRNDASWWLGSGEAWIPLLAEALQREADALKAKITEIVHPPAATPGGQERMVLFSWLEGLDLSADPLPPGIPWNPDLSRRGGPPRIWWTAGPGAGKSILGRWLELRHQWTYLRSPTWSAALRELPSSGRVYVELERAEAGAALPEDAPEELVLWVAAPFEPASPQGDENPRSKSVATHAAGWENLRVRSPTFWIDELLAWVERRVKPGGKYNAAEARDLVGRLPLEATFSTPGEVLDFLHLLDEVGAGAIQSEDKADRAALIRLWLRQALTRPAQVLTDARAALLRRDGAQILVELAQSRLRQGLPETLDLAAWEALMPVGRAPPVDTERLARLIDLRTAEALDEARSMVKPSASNLIGALQAVRALVQTGQERWGLRPAWLANLVQASAVDRLLAEGPEGVGALLLYGQSSSVAMDLLAARVAAGDLGLATACVSGLDRRSPERLAALNGAFRVIGHRAALGQDLPVELLCSAWEVQMGCVERQTSSLVRRPIISVAAASRDDLTDGDAWTRAALAISLGLFLRGHPVGESVYNPWIGLPACGQLQNEYTAALSEALKDTYMNSRGRTHASDIARACRRLGVQIVDHLGYLPQVRLLSHAAGPTLVARMAKGQDVPDVGPDLQEVINLPRGLLPFEEAAKQEQVSMDLVIAWLWSRWAKSPSGAPPLQWTSPVLDSPRLILQTEVLWRHLPSSLMTGDMLWLIGQRPVVLPWLPRPCWEAWVHGLLHSGDTQGGSEQMWGHVPEDLLLHALRDGGIPANQLRAHLQGWTRIPGALIDVLDELAPQPERPMRGGSNPVMELMFTGLSHQPEALMERAERWWRDPDAWPGVGKLLDRWLMIVIERRAPGWRRAFALLMEDRPASPGERDRPPTPRSRA